MRRSLGIAVLVAVCSGSSSYAATASAEQAALALARAQTVDTKCHYLTAAQRDQMSALVDKAQAALTAQTSEDDAKEVMARGQDDGASAACSNDEQHQVTGTFRAAMKASSLPAKKPGSAATQATATPVKPAQPTTTTPPPSQAAAAAPQPGTPPAFATPATPPAAPAVATAQPAPLQPTYKAPAPQPSATASLSPATPVAAPKPAPAVDAALRKYAAITQDYYVARRCGSGNAVGLYQSIVALHGRLIQDHDRAAISAVLRQAEIASRTRPCT